MKGRSGEVTAVAVLFFVLTWLTVGLRVYVRAIMLNTWGMDDWTMVVTVVIFTIYLAFQVTAVAYGTGQHRWELEDHDATIALIFWYLCELLYVLSSCGLKISLGIFYLRVAIQRWHVWCIKLLMAGTVLFGGVYFFLVMLQCIPVSEFWNNHPASNRCIPKAPTLGITYALAAVNAAADWTFGLLPFFIVWDLQMGLKTKMLVAGILAFAAIGSTGTVVRMKYINTLTNGPDFLWATTDVAVWSTVEPGIGITAASMATLRPLLQRCLWRLGLASEPAYSRERPSDRSSRIANKRGYRRSIRLSDLVPDEGSTSTVVSGPPPRPSNHLRGVSWAKVKEKVVDEEMRTENAAMSINRKVVVEQKVDEAPPRLQLRDSIRNSLHIFKT